MVKQPDPSDDLPKRLEKDVINELPLVRFQGSIKFAEDSKSFHRLASKLAKQRVLGFDIECKPNLKKGPNNPPHSFNLPPRIRHFFLAFTRP